MPDTYYLLIYHLNLIIVAKRIFLGKVLVLGKQLFYIDEFGSVTKQNSGGVALGTCSYLMLLQCLQRGSWLLLSSLLMQARHILSLHSQHTYLHTRVSNPVVLVKSGSGRNIHLKFKLFFSVYLNKKDIALLKYQLRIQNPATLT